MKRELMYRAKSILLLAGLLGWTASALHAQFLPFGGGGQFGGANTGARRTGTGGTATREYPNNTQVGDATITYDPETRQIIVVTDEATNEEIGTVIKTSTAPNPRSSSRSSSSRPPSPTASTSALKAATATATSPA
jgi:hypothetical protein